jgi:hypothetical protein
VYAQKGSRRKSVRLCGSERVDHRFFISAIGTNIFIVAFDSTDAKVQPVAFIAVKQNHFNVTFKPQTLHPKTRKNFLFMNKQTHL